MSNFTEALEAIGRRKIQAQEETPEQIDETIGKIEELATEIAKGLESKQITPDVILQELRAQIRNERRLQGLTQRDLAAKAGLSQSTITRAERYSWISLNCLCRIAMGLGKKVIIS